MLISDSEWEQLQQLADREGITASDLVRQYIRRQHVEVFGEQQTKPAKRKRGK